MPIGLGVAALTGGVKLIGGALSNRAQRKENNANRAWQLEQWNRQNAYNTPQAQMQRLQEAKLNPNLVYGSSANTGNAGAVGTPQTQALRYDHVGEAAASTVNTYYDTQLKTAQTNNLEADNTVKVQEAIKKAAETNQIGVMTEQKRVELKNLQRYSSEILSAQLHHQQESTLSMQQQALQSRDLHKPNLKSKNSEAQIKANEALLSRYGLTPKDPIYAKLLVLKKQDLLKILNNF